MFGKRKARIIPGANVTPLRNTDRMFRVECVIMVPHVYSVAVPAPNGSAACRLATDIVRQAPETGVPDFAGRRDFHVREIKELPLYQPARPEPVPPEFTKRDFRETPGSL